MVDFRFNLFNCSQQPAGDTLPKMTRTDDQTANFQGIA
jgi:hypothetical protein